MQNISLQLALDELELIGRALAAQPYREVFVLLAKIQSQVNAQQATQASEPPKKAVK